MCSMFLIKPQNLRKKTSCVCSKVPAVTIAILNCTSFHSLCCLMNRKGKSLNKQCFYQNNKMFCSIKSYNTRVRMLSFSTDTAPQSFCHSFIALSMIRCSKSVQKSDVQMCQVATVVMETTQLFLS